MEQDAERKSFARVRGYLNYSVVAKWTALVMAVATGILYVAMLALLWLFADLVVSHGRIPDYDDLLPEEQALFAEKWTDNDLGYQTLKDLGLGPVDLDKLKVEDKLTPAKFQELSAGEKGVYWRLYISRTLSERVSGQAGASVLPSLAALPESEQKKVAQAWVKRDEGGGSDPRRFPLEEAGFPAERVTELLTAEAAALQQPETREAIWHAYLYLTFDSRGQTDAREEALQRLRTIVQGTASERVLSNRGVLPLIVRANLHGRLSTPVLGWMTRWNGWWMWKQGNTTYLGGLLIGAVILALLRAGASFLMKEMAARAVIEAATRLRRAVYHHTFRLGTLAFKQLGPSEAVSIFTRHIEAIHDALYVWLTVIFREPVKFGLLLAFALVVNFWLALAFLLFAILVWLIGGQAAAYFRRQGRTAASQAAERLTLIRESLMMMRLVKTYLMELFNQSRVERQLARYAAAQKTRYRGEAIYRPLLVGLGTLAALVLLYVGGLIVLHGQLGVASAIALAVALVSLYWPVEGFLENRRFMRRGREASVALFHFLDRPGDVGQVVGAEFLPPMTRRLEFDNVSLREPGSNRMLLHDVTLAVQAGQRVGIIGADDVEKHALVYLIPRFLDPTSGEIRIDEHNLRWVTLDSLRVQSAMVMQNDLVFHDTVANNIGCGDQSYKLPQIIEAAKTAHAHHFISKLPEGYETPIGEMGHSLTLGEKYRIALARAILRDPALLVIEESETPLDDNTKSLIDDTMTRVLPGRTVIFLPHRISTIRSCDQLFLVHKGRIEAVGDHRELLAQNPLYRHLHYIEFNEIAEQV